VVNDQEIRVVMTTKDAKFFNFSFTKSRSHIRFEPALEIRIDNIRSRCFGKTNNLFQGIQRALSHAPRKD
jgi:hypothetical protein